ncbi:MAG: hypothetical protein KDA53_01600 [Hyphomonas sp.]|nr:hypothetical protein [Hyphomonas sp.]
MILRRLTDALRKQDWFTVAIETLIVVLGVFLGLQVNNWNAARQDRISGSFYLSSIGDDIASDAEFLEANLINLQRESEHAVLIDRFLQGEDVGVSDWDMFQIIYYRAGWTPFSANRVTYDELLSAGQFRLVGNAELRREIADYYAGIDDFAIFYQFQPPLRELIRSKYSPPVQAYMWESCFPGAHYRTGHGAFTKCAPFEDADLVTATLDSLRQTEGILDAVRYTQSVRIIVMGAAETDLEEARTLSARIAETAR